MNLSSSPVSLGLVAAQFLLIGLLVSPIKTLLPTSISDLPGALCLAACGALALWAFISLRLRNFTVTPEPRDGATLITHGPYAWIRHPMYTAVLLLGLGAVLIRATPTDAVQCVLLAAVMLAKIHREEGLLSNRYPEYAAYRAHTKALIPGVY